VNRPKFIVSEIDFKIIFYRGPTIPELSKKCQETVRNWPEIFPETARKTFEYIKDHPESTNKEIGKALEITERSVRNHCAILKDTGYIRRNGSDKTGFWEILKEE
jgi:predicted HTH transcriptional regulator